MKKIIFILTLLFIGLQGFSQNFVEKQSVKHPAIQVTISLGNNQNIDGFKTVTDNYYVLKTSKKTGKEYRYYLGRDTEKEFNNYKVFVTGKKVLRYYYYTLKDNKLHRKELILESDEKKV